MKFFKTLQLHLQFSDLLELLALLGLAVLIVLSLRASGEQLIGAIRQPTLSLAHLDRAGGVISGNLFYHLTATDRLHGDPGLKLWAVGATPSHR